MKKTAVLLAGLLLVTGTVFAEGWEVSKANIEGTFDLIDTQEGSGFSNGDIDLDLKWSKEVKEGLTYSATIEANESGADSIAVGAEIAEGDFTAAIAMDYNPGLSADGFNVDAGDGNYIGWNVMGMEELNLAMYPYDVAGWDWDEDTFVVDTDGNIPGIKATYKLAEETTVKFLYGTADNDNLVNDTYMRADLSTKVSGISLDAYSLIKAEKAKNDDTNESKEDGAMALGAKASIGIEALTISGELNTVAYKGTDDKGKAEDQMAMGLFAKAEYSMGDMNGYATTPYASFKNLNEYVSNVDSDATDDYTKIEAGVKLVQGSFTVTPKLIMESTKAKTFTEELKSAGANDKVKSATRIALTFGYSM
jgi:hypothetical protein